MWAVLISSLKLGVSLLNKGTFPINQRKLTQLIKIILLYTSVGELENTAHLKEGDGFCWFAFLLVTHEDTLQTIIEK